MRGNAAEIGEVLARARAVAGRTDEPTLDDACAPPASSSDDKKGEVPARQHEPKKCASCPAPILWAQSLDDEGRRIWDEERKRFKSMPVDWEPVPTGNVVVWDRPGEGFVCRVLKKGETPPAGARLRTSHFATCPNAKQHRRTRHGA